MSGIGSGIVFSIITVCIVLMLVFYGVTRFFPCRCIKTYDKIEPYHELYINDSNKIDTLYIYTK